MIRSIRGRLQAWYALVLLGVVGTFAGILLIQVRQARFQDIDQQLVSGVLYLEANLRRFPPSELDPSRPEKPPPWPDRFFDKGPKKGPPPDKGDGFGFGHGKGEKDRKRPAEEGKEKHHGPHGPDRPFGPPPPPPGGNSKEQLLAELDLPKELTGPPPPPDAPPGDEARPYFVIWRTDGSLLKSTTYSSEYAFTEHGASEFTDRPSITERGENREVLMRGPEGSRILVGRPIAKELAELNTYTWQVVGAGAVVLAIGLLGGWLISGRIVRPIAMISRTASAISASNLSGRIDTGKVDSELAMLATVLNDMFQRLQLEFERQARFTADASHELRTPLAVIHSHSQLALARPRSAEEYRTTIESCLRASTRMVSLVEDLLILARFDADKLELERRAFDLRQLIADNIAYLAPLAAKNAITITSELAPLEIFGDPRRVGQVLTNLLTNAIRYNREGGNVFVRLRAEGNEAFLEVSDTGCGIPEADQPHLFERFFRVDKARTRESGGNGLGLAICKSIIDAHGGTIGCTSRWREGTTFWVRLPIKPLLSPARSAS